MQVYAIKRKSDQKYASPNKKFSNQLKNAILYPNEETALRCYNGDWENLENDELFIIPVEIKENGETKLINKENFREYNYWNKLYNKE